MQFELDIRTLLVVAALLRGAQALAMVMTWLAHRNHPPARLWALGSSLTTLGIVMAALRDALPAPSAVFLGNASLLAGALVFHGGVVQAAGRRPPWRWGWAAAVGAAFLCAWFNWGDPSVAGRIAVLGSEALLVQGFTILACLRYRGLRAGLSFKLLALVLALQAGVALWSAFDAVRIGLVGPLQGSLAMRVFLLSVVLSTLLVTALLILVTSQGLQEQLEALAAYDPLTGLMNRRAFETVTDIEWARAQRQHGVLCCLVLDVDHFKRLNDTLGHAAGDRALVAVAATLRVQLRGQDLLCRHGGEEFVCLLPGAHEAQGLVVAERMREAIALVSPGVGVPPLTVSIGVAQSRPRGGSWSEVLAAADAAMYEAKRAGRNRCVVGCPGGDLVVPTANAEGPRAAA